MKPSIEKPLVSIIIPTFNRSTSLEKAIKSVLNQTYENIEVIVVDDGSIDDTSEMLNRISDKRLRIIKHNKNRGVCAAKNTGFDHIKGDWFFIVDSDDELLPQAIEELMKVPLEFDHDINHVTCNIVEFETNKFLGVGMEKDQYWDEELIYTKTRGEFKGLIKTSILGKDRLNENIVGREGILWAKVRARSKGYYIHKGLYIVHKEGEDRVCKQMSDFDINRKASEYREIKEDHIYWGIMEKYSNDSFLKQCLRGVIIPLAVKDKATAKVYAEKIINSDKINYYYKLFIKVVLIGGPGLSKVIYRIYNT